MTTDVLRKRIVKKTKKDRAGNETGHVYRASFIHPDTGKEVSRNFALKKDAKAWLDSTTVELATGTYVEPSKAALTLRGYYSAWSSAQVWESGTRRAMDLAVLRAPFADKALGDITLSHDVQPWIRRMQSEGLAPGTIRTRFTNVRSVVRAARDDGHVRKDPTARASLPRVLKASASLTVPTPEQVAAIVAAADDGWGSFFLTAALAGTRLGETAALQVGDISFLTRELHVRRQVQRANGGVVEVRAPKYGSVRSVPIPTELVEVLAEHVRLHTDGQPTSWLWTTENMRSPAHQNTVGYRWRKACRAAGVSGYKLHDLRHFFASATIAAGCDVVTVQNALGHKSPAVTLNVYASLWPSSTDRIRAATTGLLPLAVGSA